MAAVVRTPTHSQGKCRGRKADKRSVEWKCRGRKADKRSVEWEWVKSVYTGM